MKTPYFAFYRQDWLADNKVMMMTYEEKGVYIDILCHMWNYQNENCFLPDNDTFMCRLLRIKPQKWKRLKKTFVDGPYSVFFIDDGKIFSYLIQERNN